MTKPWDEHRETIVRQYKEQKKPLHEVQRFMEEKHRFKASTRAYRSRFDRWGVHKYTCRKRRGSFANAGRISASDDAVCDDFSPAQSPDLDDEGSASSPLASSPAMSPADFFVQPALLT
ncbi:Clr5 domain-containing protein [Lasiosphaeria miniovina]|uniref:Clr5 domain-containing protein n=1 Tax=Lasiosphaeria miniovina TaxID=1954250 RepID=A0AA40A5M4_9PEZI|nr:Clr5 domain-containing protein [Lasiosphaeria miniovina]KAK0709778.1 Clr5 domain-containing protein [Lasiosphaeria miniovina]